MTSIKKAGLAGFILTVIFVCYFAVFGFRTIRVETIRKQVDQSVPVGASVDEVARALDVMHIEHSGVERPKLMLMGGRRYDNLLVVQAIHRNTWRSLLIREDVELIFVFDDSRKLSRIDIFPIWTGP